MRKIKFMGKPVDGGNWVYGSLVRVSCYGKEVCLIIALDEITEHDKDLGWELDSNVLIEVIPSSVGQFTEFKDKDGGEIYGGHIVKVIDPNVSLGEMDIDVGKGEVKWFNEYGFWNIEGDIDDSLGDVITSSENIVKIIGTSTDNPELLK